MHLAVTVAVAAVAGLTARPLHTSAHFLLKSRRGAVSAGDFGLAVGLAASILILTPSKVSIS